MKYYALRSNNIINSFEVIFHYDKFVFVKTDDDYCMQMFMKDFNPIEIPEEYIIGLESLDTYFPYHKVFVDETETSELGEDADKPAKVKKIVYFTDEEIKAGIEIFKLLYKSKVENILNDRYISKNINYLDSRSWEIQRREIESIERNGYSETNFIEELAAIEGVSKEEYVIKVKTKIKEHNDFLLNIIKLRKEILSDLSKITEKCECAIFANRWFGYEFETKLLEVSGYDYDESKKRPGGIQF